MKRSVNKKMEEIYLGLDIGTNSCGYAVTDGNYNLVRIGGKDAWGVRLFEKAETAQERRAKRTARRRVVRKKLQNLWLQQLFEKEIEKIDPSFFTRLKYSNLHLEDKILSDKNLTSKYSLFNDTVKQVFTDKEYYEKYKTVYHLREKLLKNPAEDVRLLYLAIHSILTHRGHFLSETDFSSNVPIEDSFNNLLDKLSAYSVEFNDGKNVLTIKADKISGIFLLLEDFAQGLSYRQVKENFEKNLDVKTKLDKTVASILLSGKFKTTDVFAVEKEDAVKVDFNDEKFEEVYGTLSSQLSETELAILNLFKDLYSSIQLKKLLGKNDYICEAMVERYDKHNEQLKELKTFVKTYFPSKKNLVFNAQKTSKKKKEEKSGKIANYAAYCYSDLKDGKKQIIDGVASREDFYKFIKNELLECSPEVETDLIKFEEQKQKILNSIEKNDYLLKIRSHDNIVLPNSLYKVELQQILKINEKKFKFLSEKDEKGKTISEKIIDIICFRIPYFVGPIGQSERGWIRKDKNLDFKPWTLNEIINFDEAEDKFIQNMTSKCTYLPTEDVLPKDSLLYSKFRVLNELNNLKVNGNDITVETKQRIFKGLFEKYKKISKNKLIEFLKQENIYPKNESIVITGIDNEFANNYSSYVTLANKFGEEFVNKNYDVFEKIIKYHTIISDKLRLEKRIKREFKIFSNEDVKFLKSLNYSGWGKLSGKFLNGIKFADKKSNSPEFESKTIISAMWETNKNLQEVIFCKEYNLLEKLEANIEKIQRDLVYEDVQNMYTSPSVKRGTWQAISIINELKSKLGKYPDKIFIEVTRNDQEKGDKGRKDSRFGAVVKKYKDKTLKEDCLKEAINYNNLLDELNKRNNSHLRSEKLFLYFMQLGKDAYTGEPIDIAELGNDNAYNVDHIIPRSKVKDDSLDNKVLVSAAANLAKGDEYPLKRKIQFAQKDFWRMLNKNGLMSDKKLARLERTEEFTDKDADDFTNQQLVSTNQESKAVIDLLSKVYDNRRNIVFSKAMFVTEFRNRYNIFKSRDVNDLHHAKDAFLNVVVGNVLFNRFTQGYWKKDKNIKILEDENRVDADEDKNEKVTSVVDKVFGRYVWSNQTGEVVWKGWKDVERIQKICYQNSPIISIMPYVNRNGAFYDETIYKKKNDGEKFKAAFALKEKGPMSSIEKYGGFNSVNNAYFMVVESVDNKGRIKKTIECVPIIVEYKYRNDPDKKQKVIKFIEETNNIKITRVIKDELKFRSVLKINGGLYMLTAKTSDSFKVLKLNQWYISNSDTGYIKILEKYKNMPQVAKECLKEDGERLIVSPAVKENSRPQIITRTQNVELYDLIINQLSKKIYDLSSIKAIVSNLKDKRDLFIALSIPNQTEVLLNLVKYVGGGYLADLKLLGGTEHMGTTRISKDITDLNIYLIEQSVTGLYSKGTKL